ncbi:hypothetical protein EST38_g5428 [Candolleomyces aberdarensis]|uniref:Uncharacterized protein n=1 Tax=Candolleomyces aberdarensis TaxID=2316362 RepID=A0A4Q2DKI7_9AGAR|nr:hypothetical protein EST38_g5428 [Candolleomyces aberdarensis]
MDYRLPMLATTLFFLSCGESGLAAPFPTPSNPYVEPLGPRDEPRFLTNYRSTPEIIWTCLITTFLCTWVSMHPNVVGYGSTRWQRLGRQTKMFLVAFVAPEIPLLSALQQCIIARHIVNRMNKRRSRDATTESPAPAVATPFWRRFLGINKRKVEQEKDNHLWKMSHGYFLLMGGVIFSINGRFEYLELGKLLKNGNDVSPDDILAESDGNEPNGNNLNDEQPIAEDDGSNSNKENEESKNSKPATDNKPNDDSALYTAARKALECLPTRDMEMCDRSKGDAVTKSLTLIQTTWFIVQLASRKAQNLNVNALEVFTLAYAVMILFVYIFWWDKPLNVQCPIIIGLPPVEHEATDPPTSHSKQPEGQESNPIPQNTSTRCSAHSAPNGFIEYVYTPQGLDANFRMNTITYLVTLGLLGVFGSIYYIAWGFTFPLPIGQKLWRVFCIVVTLVPWGFILVMVIATLIGFYILNLKGLDKSRRDIVGFVFVGFYAVIRLMLVSLALWSLHELPSDGHQTVVWARFIPHF